jgi:hypothetical protein
MRKEYIQMTGRDDIGEGSGFSQLTDALFTVNPTSTSTSASLIYMNPVEFLSDYGFSNDELRQWQSSDNDEPLYPTELASKTNLSETIIEVFNKLSCIPVFGSSTSSVEEERIHHNVQQVLRVNNNLPVVGAQ